jgi:type I restriction enzyme S subunit
MELKPGYKQTEVGVIPEDWEISNLGSLGIFSKGNGIKKDEANSGDIPCVRYGEIYTFHNDIVRSFNSSISEVVAKGSKLLRYGDILFAGSGETREEIGKSVAFIEHKVAYAGGDIVILSNTKESPSFLGYQLNSSTVARQKSIKGQGDAVVHISASALSTVLVPIPPTKAEQEAIAGALSDADELIASLEQLIDKKQMIKQGAMQELLTGKKRLPGFQQNPGYKQTEVGEIPEDWECKTINEVAKVTRGASPRPIDSPIWFDLNSNIGWVRISDVTKSNIFLTETTQKLSTLGIKHSRPVKKGNLIMSICATVGRPMITQIDVCIHDGFVVLDSLKVNQRFLYYVLAHIEDDWSRHGQTGSQMNLNTGLINQTKVRLPNNEIEQEAVASVLSDMDAEIDALGEKLEKARKIKAGMMHNLLTGTIRLV